MTPEQLIEARDQLNAYFAAKSASEGIPINPVQIGMKDFLLMERYYYEQEADRAFHVCAREDLPLDGFTKQTGLEFEVELLWLGTNSVNRDAPILWTAYVEWMHRGVDAQTVFRTIGLKL